LEKLEYIIIDIETTGLDKDSSSIIEVGALLISNNVIKDRFSSFVKYDRTLSEEVKRITKINDGMLEGAPDIKEVIIKLKKFIGKYPVVAHNGLNFDFPILERCGLKIGQKYDSMEFTFFVLPINKNGHSMPVLAEQFGIEAVPHRALGDCEILFQLIYKLQEEYGKRKKIKVEALNYIAKSIDWWWVNFLSEKAKKHNIASLIPKYIPQEKNHQKQLKLEIDELFINQEDYSEDRPEQKKMANLVLDAFNNHKHLVIEAGTGTGKSKAYLVPSFLFALKNNVPVIISTYTKALQDQLFDKEIPHIRKILNRDIRVAILKGKKNYVCLQKFNDFADGIEASISQRSLNISTKNSVNISNKLAYLLISSWILETDRGYWDELPYWFKIRIAKEIEGDICNVDELCTKDTCDFHKDQKCFLAKARAKAKDADIIIANHALALLEISIEEIEDEHGEKKKIYNHAVFPEESKFIVFDEAHYLEDAATSAWERTISEDIFYYLFQQLSRISKLKLKEKSEEKNIKSSVDNLFSIILPQAIIEDNKEGYSSEKLINSVNSIAQKEINANLENIKLDLTNIVKIIDNTVREETSLKDDRFLLISRKTISSLVESIDLFLQKEEGYIKYLERDKDDIKIKIVPLSVAQHLKDCVYDNFDSVILTSATLAVNKNFNFFANRCGTLNIDKDRINYYLLKSSFDYGKQVKFFVPSGINYKVNIIEEHLKKSIEFLKKAILASDGGSLVLCTSHKQINYIYDELIELLSKNNITLLRQSKGFSSNDVIKTFKEDINSVLIGTETFWQGIDVPGKSLRSLFILKIPYNQLSSIIKARRDSINGDSFIEYYEPLAAIKLKQGFGRLIRKSSDYGVVVILDENFINKKNLINSLPDGVSPKKMSIKEILEELKLI